MSYNGDRFFGAGGSAMAIMFSGRWWDLKTYLFPDRFGPGPNYWSPQNVSADAVDTLHLRIDRGPHPSWYDEWCWVRWGFLWRPRWKGPDCEWCTGWYCAEVTSQDALGYGTYEITFDSDVSSLDLNVVLGLSVYEADDKEIDIEFGFWGRAPTASNATNFQYVVQPAERHGHLKRYTLAPVPGSTHSFTWTENAVEFWSTDSAPNDHFIYKFIAGDTRPDPATAKTHLNLWLRCGAQPWGLSPVEVLIKSFRFTPFS